jgi:integrase
MRRPEGHDRRRTRGRLSAWRAPVRCSGTQVLPSGNCSSQRGKRKPKNRGVCRSRRCCKRFWILIETTQRGSRYLRTVRVRATRSGASGIPSRTAWRLTCKRAKIDGLHFHDLRGRLAPDGWMPACRSRTIQRWLGITQTQPDLRRILRRVAGATLRQCVRSIAPWAARPHRPRRVSQRCRAMIRRRLMKRGHSGAMH